MKQVLTRYGATRLSSRILPTPAAYVLVGMAAVGKTTYGRRLAAELALPFIDTDALLCETVGCSLEDLLAKQGPESFCDLEESTVLSVQSKPAVIATGGSIIYRPRAIAHLQRFGIVLWLDAPTSDIIERHRQREPRGLIWLPADLPSMEALIEYRAALYRQAADYHLMLTRPD